ncbi:MAG: hypothetical protein WAZ18_01275 [Alphaproteobacteria bacterium]
MMRWLLVMVVLVGSVQAKALNKEPVRKPNPPLEVNGLTLMERGPDVQSVMVEVAMGKGGENPQWMMTYTNMQVLLGLLQREDGLVPPMDPKVLAAAPNPEPTYKGMDVVLKTVQGEKFKTMRVFMGKVVSGGKVVREDAGRALEYWLFSTARVKRDLMLGARVLPVWTFGQCRMLGMQVVDTEPRQCVMPDGGLILETAKKPTKASVTVKDFDQCLVKGTSLIATFPRRCVVAGGRVFTEPPRVKEPEPADAPLAEGATTRLDVPSPTVVVSESVVAPSPTVITNPVLGAYVVCAAAVVSGSEVSMTGVPMVSPTLGVLVSGTLGGAVSGSVVDAFVPDVAPAAGPEVMPWFERLNRWWGLK